MSIMLAVVGCVAASLSDYGITLPSSIALSRTSTSSVQSSLVFNVDNGNEVGWITGSGINYHTWNEYGLPKDSYEVRLVHVSGSLPSSGADVGVWLSAALTGNQLTWRWARSTPGTTTGSFLLEIRNKYSQQVIASCPVSVNVVYQVPYQYQGTMFVGSEPLKGQTRGHGIDYGSIDPQNVPGRGNIVNLSQRDNGNIVFTLDQNQPTFFTQLSIGGRVLNASSATRTTSSTGAETWTIWTWESMPLSYIYNYLGSQLSVEII